MPVFGKQDVQAAAERAPLMSGLDTDPWELKGAEILQLTFEVVEDPAEWLVAPALHPSIPPYATLSVARFPDSPVGPFALAQVRLVVRAGIRPRGYLLGAYTDSEKAATELRTRWGFTVDQATIGLQARHDRVIGTVERNGHTILDMEAENPEHISGADVTYLDSLHLVRVNEDGQEKPLIVQIDPEYVFHAAQRGIPHLKAFNAAAWGGENRLQCTSPMTATFTRCDTDLPRMRFALDPSVPAMQGSRKLAA
jgi:hypothetical protein